MTTMTGTIARTDVPTGLPYDELSQRFESTLGTWHPATAQGFVERRAPWPDVEAEAAKIAGSFGLMIIAAINQGQLTSLSGYPKKCRLYLVGNPVIATRILDIDPLGALYVPFRVAIYAGDGSGARISFDRPGSSLATLGNATIDAIGRQLDDKIDAVVQAICGRESV
ncbi:DUF302 domain-containing protein [Hyphomicrobium sp. xq]|uniref:DUF302 domain-containing protein n=1 Tax=Hyphomicrobium album TaxID=2665159 RepID=A0A6I3KIR8_9HYPH|nr:DUF302 domain-containing protein [Hyphomicrobium album]MTD94243.1 DUF302 domain-containing protein [Hyphomicrobium album]